MHGTSIRVTTDDLPALVRVKGYMMREAGKELTSREVLLALIAFWEAGHKEGN